MSDNMANHILIPMDRRRRRRRRFVLLSVNLPIQSVHYSGCQPVCPSVSPSWHKSFCPFFLSVRPYLSSRRRRIVHRIHSPKL